MAEGPLSWPYRTLSRKLRTRRARLRSPCLLSGLPWLPAARLSSLLRTNPILALNPPPSQRPSTKALTLKPTRLLPLLSSSRPLFPQKLLLLTPQKRRSRAPTPETVEKATPIPTEIPTPAATPTPDVNDYYVVIHESGYPNGIGIIKFYASYPFKKDVRGGADIFKEDFYLEYLIKEKNYNS